VTVRALINGQPGDSISVRDRGLQYGDGVFETIAVRRGVPLLWERHLERLQEGTQRLQLPAADTDQLWQEATSLCRDTERGVLKLIYTRGSSERGYRAPSVSMPNRVFYLAGWPASASIANAAVCVCRTPLGDNPLLAGIKHLNRIEQVLARAEWTDQYSDGLMLDLAGNVIEATAANVFAVVGQTLRTPELSRCGVAGVMRGLVLEQAARLGIPCEIAPLTLTELHGAHEVFLTNSIIGVQPVTTLEGKAYKVGKIAQTLRKEIQSLNAVA
jgi:4-amino-4-deoxychorismate lyase